MMNWCDKIINKGLLLFCLFSPISITAAEASLVIVLLAWIVKVIKGEKRWIKSPLDIPILTFVLLSAISCLFSQNLLHSLDKIRSLWICLLYFVVTNHLKEGECKRLLKVLIVVTFLVSLYGIFAYFSKIELIHPGRNFYRISGTFSIPLTFGEYLMLILSLIFSIIISKEKTIFFGIFGLIITLALIYTYTRSSWLGMIGSLIFIGLMRKKLVITFLMFLLFLPIFLFDNSIRKRAITSFDPSLNIDRIVIWKASLGMIKEHPLTGIGMGNWSKMCPSYGVSKGFSTSHAHNNILHIAATCGLIVAAVFLWIWIAFFIFGIKGYFKMKEGYSKGVVLGSLGGMIGLNISGLFENNFFDSEVALLMWFIMGLTMTILKK